MQGVSDGELHEVEIIWQPKALDLYYIKVYASADGFSPHAFVGFISRGPGKYTYEIEKAATMQERKGLLPASKHFLEGDYFLTYWPVPYKKLISMRSQELEDGK